MLNRIEGPAEAVSVEPRSMEVLCHLVEHAGEVRSRQEVLDAVWGEAFVSEEVLSHCIWDLRKALGDNARQPKFIQTIPRRGYRLIAEVSDREQANSSAAGEPGEGRRAQREIRAP